MSFVNSVKKELNKTAHTEKGAISYASTLDKVLDFFSKSGALRQQHNDQLDYFMKAYEQDATLADKALFYSRDIRHGQGERDLFKNIVKWLATRYPEEFRPNLKYIPEFGRWDDLYSFVGTPLEAEAFKVMKEQFDKDVKDLNEGHHVSLLGKWLKSENTSSKESCKLGKLTRKAFGINNPKEYRQILSSLRKEIEVVEKLMSAKDWDEINYEHVPSKAMKNYTKAFKKHDEDRYNEYISRVKKGEAKINAGTLYPYDIVHKYLRNDVNSDEEATYEELWKHLPNYFEGIENGNSMCVIDVSGSMYDGRGNVLPIDVAISLGLYMTERNNGPFKNHFITFETNPGFVEIYGNSLKDKINNIRKAEWEGSTNLIATFKLILDVARKNNLKDEDMPRKLFIISDMQFDDATDDNSLTNFEQIDKMYKEAGYKRPDLVFWNVNAHSDNPVQKDERGTLLVSGISPSILEHALKAEETTPYDFMIEVLNSDRYKCIV